MYGAIAIGVLVGGIIVYVAMRTKSQGFSREEAAAFGELGREAIQKKITARKETVLLFVREHGKVTNDDVEGLFCDISDNTAGNYLRELVEEGKLVRKGAGRGTYYELP